MSSTPMTDSNILIAEYTLGLLNLQEASQAQTLLGTSSQAAMAALKWESRFLELVDLLPPAEPGPQTLRELQAALGHPLTPSPVRHQTIATSPLVTRPAPAAPTPIKPEDDTLSVATALRTPEKPLEIPGTPAIAPAGTPAPTSVSASQAAKTKKTEPKRTRNKHAWLWPAASIVFALIAATLALKPSQPAIPPVTVVEVAPTRAAIMQAPGQSSTPGWVVTIDPAGSVLMQPKVRTDVPSDASVQLWTHNQLAPQPRSLGLIDPNQPVTVPANLMGEIAQDQIFEMTQEPAGGSATASPSGPILFIGRIVTFGKPSMAPPVSDPATPGEQSGS